MEEKWVRPDHLGPHAMPSSLQGFQRIHSALNQTARKADSRDHKPSREGIPDVFRGLVHTQDYSCAIASAHKAGEITCSDRMLILWTDASLTRDSDNTDPASYAVAARKSSGWTGRFGYSFDTCIDNAEMCAISAALAMAIDEVKQSKAEGNHPGGFGPVVRIYTDSRSSLDKISAYPQEPWGPGYRRQRFILKTIVDQSRELEDMAQLMLHWVPRHRVDANRVADKIAKNALSVFRTSNKEGSTEGIAAQDARGNGILNKPVVTDNHGALAAFEDSVLEQTAKEDVAGVEHAAQQPRL